MWERVNEGRGFRESERDSIGVWGRVDVRGGQGEWEGQHRGVG